MFIYFNRSNRGHGTSPHSSSIWTMSSSEHCWQAIFQIYNVQNLKITRITTFRICNIVYQAGSWWDPKCVFNFLHFFERTLYKSNYIIFILSWCGTHTKIRSKLVDIVTAGSQNITLWGPQRNPLGILRVNWLYYGNLSLSTVVSVAETTFWQPLISRQSWGESWKPKTKTCITVMHRLMTGIHSEKCVVKWFHRRANVIECNYTNLDSIAYYTPKLYGIAQGSATF